MRALFSADEMRRVDEHAVRVLRIPAAQLMENAGRNAARIVVDVLSELGVRRGARVAIVCGKGGNGGDGFVVAHALRRAGFRPDV